MHQHTNDHEFDSLKKTINQVKQRSTNILRYHYNRKTPRDRGSVDSFRILEKTEHSRALRHQPFDKLTNNDSIDLYQAA